MNETCGDDARRTSALTNRSTIFPLPTIHMNIQLDMGWSEKAAVHESGQRYIREYSRLHAMSGEGWVGYFVTSCLVWNEESEAGSVP